MLVLLLTVAGVAQYRGRYDSGGRYTGTYRERFNESEAAADPNAEAITFNGEAVVFAGEAVVYP